MKMILKMLSIILFVGVLFLAIPKQSALADFAMAPTQVTATSGPGSGEITLMWNQSGTVGRYALVFGLESNKYTMGLLNFPQDKRLLTVMNMTSRKKYFFRVWTYMDPSGAATTSSEVSAVAK